MVYYIAHQHIFICSQNCKQSKYFTKVIETKFNKPLAICEKYHEILMILLNVWFVKKHMKKVKWK